MNFEFLNFNMMLLSQPTHEEGKPRRQRWALASGGVVAGCSLSFTYLQKSTRWLELGRLGGFVGYYIICCFLKKSKYYYRRWVWYYYYDSGSNCFSPSPSIRSVFVCVVLCVLHYAKYFAYITVFKINIFCLNAARHVLIFRPLWQLLLPRDRLLLKSFFR